MPLWGQYVDGDQPTAAETNSPLPRCVLYATDAQQATANTTVWATFGAGTEQSDPLGFHSTTTNTERITPTVAGLYRVVGNWRVNGAMGAGARITLRLNGTTTIAMEANDLANTAANSALSVITTLKLNGTTDYVELGITNGSATNRTCTFKGLAVIFLGAA